MADPQGQKLLKNALIDVDGTLAGTYGKCKEGMDISHKGIWWYHPLIISHEKGEHVLFDEIVAQPRSLRRAKRIDPAHITEIAMTDIVDVIVLNQVAVGIANWAARRVANGPYRPDPAGEALRPDHLSLPFGET